MRDEREREREGGIEIFTLRSLLIRPHFSLTQFSVSFSDGRTAERAGRRARVGLIGRFGIVISHGTDFCLLPLWPEKLTFLKNAPVSQIAFVHAITICKRENMTQEGRPACLPACLTKVCHCRRARFRVATIIKCRRNIWTASQSPIVKATWRLCSCSWHYSFITQIRI